MGLLPFAPQWYLANVRSPTERQLSFDNIPLASENETEAVLIDFYHHMNGEYWKNNTYWLEPDVSYCQWHGVSCAPNTVDVIGLELHSNDVAGQLPDSFSNLTSLKILDLSSNLIKGYIPTSWASLQNLTSLNLKFNLFSNLDGLAALTNLRRLVLDALLIRADASTGFLRNLSKLQMLDLSANYLTSIPREISSMPDLRYLRMVANRVSSLEYLKDCPSLESLDLAFNFGNATSLRFVDSLSFLSNLQHLNISRTTDYPIRAPGILSALLPLSQLRTLLLRNVFINDTFPPTFFPSLPNLEVLDLSGANLLGEIPKDIDQSASLQELSLQENSLNGDLPSGLWNLLRLAVLNTTHNYLSGPISENISNLTHLQILHAGFNGLFGDIPDLLPLQKLSSINLRSNRLTGSVPPKLGHMYGLLDIDLSNNSLSGNLTDLKYCFKLKFLDFSNNNLFGSIPQLDCLQLMHVVRNSNNG